MLGYYGLWGELPRILGDHLYNAVIPRAVANEDSTRPYWPGSPYAVSYTHLDVYKRQVA